MQTEQAAVSNGRLWAGRVVSGLPALFLLVDGGMKLVKPAVVVDATVKLGYSESAIIPIGVVFILFRIRLGFAKNRLLGQN